MRRRVLIGALLAASLALVANCVFVFPLPEPDGDPQEAETAAAEAPAWKRTRRLEPAALPAQPAEVSAGRVLFFPTLNRSRYRIHPSWLAAFERTLAAYSAAFLGLEPVPSWAAEAIGRELGAPDAYAAAAELVVDEALAARAARRAGAASIVWVELAPDLGVHLFARDFGAPAVAQWDGLELPSIAADGEPGGDLDRSLYDAPRQLLAALIASARVPARQASATRPADAGGQLRDAVALQGAGSVAELRRSEQRLVSLVARDPDWNEAWIELAALQARRVMANQGSYVGDAPAIARNLALASAGLAPGGAARLAAVDQFFLAHQARDGELERVMAALAPEDPLRALLAAFYYCYARELFRVEGVRAETVLDHYFLTLGAAGGEAAREKAVMQLAESPEGEAALRSPAMLRFLGLQARARNELGTRDRYAIAEAIYAAIGAFELAREICLELPAASAPVADCWKVLRDGLDIYASGSELPTDAAALADDAVFRPLLGSAIARFLEVSVAGARSDLLPDVDGLEWRPFRPLWLLAATLSDVANGALKARERAGFQARRESALLSDARAQLMSAVDRIVVAAYGAAARGAFRGQKDEWAPYVEALRPFVGYPDAALNYAAYMQMHRRMAESDKMFERLAHADPYHANHLSRWLGRVLAGTSHSSAYQAEAWLETLVPRTRDQTLALADLLDRMEQPDAAVALLDRGLARRFDDSLAEARASRIRDPFGSERKKIAILEPVASRFPFRFDLIAELAHLHRRIGSYERARDLANVLIEQPRYFNDACTILVADAAHQGNVPHAIGIFESCAKQAPDQWKRAQLETWAAAMHNDLGNHGRAIALYESAANEVGGAGWVLAGMGRSRMWAGDHAGARRDFERNVELYPDAWWTYRDLAWLALREGDTVAARRVMEKARSRGGQLADEDYRLYGAIFLREGNLAGFENLCVEANTWTAVPALAEARASVLGAAAAAAIPEPLAKLGTPGQRAALEGEYLMEAGRYAEAIPRLEEGLLEGSFLLRPKLIEAYVRTGRPDLARARRDDYAKWFPVDWGVHYMDGVLAFAEGRRADAEKALLVMRSTFPNKAQFPYGETWKHKAVLRLELSLYPKPRPPKVRARMLRTAEHVANRMFWEPGGWEALAELRAEAGDAKGAQAARAMLAALAPERRAPVAALAK